MIDKMRAPFPFIYLRLLTTRCTQEYSRQVPTTEGASFAQRTGCLCVEASAKTAVGVSEAGDVVARIIDTPALWGEAQGVVVVQGPDRGGSRA
ncbi:hypothetical protein EDB86DRAFT_2959938 [Lactarius hatsudake]|nr:hypothetical protein EDB86DRAFT_2959938 [Lactarius hatsudake]